MISEQVGEVLSTYLDGELSPRRQRATEELLQKSAEAREYVQRLRESANLVQTLPRRVPERDLVDAALAALAPCTPLPVPATSGQRWRGWLPLGVAAGILFVAGTASLVYLAGPRKAKPGIADVAPEKPVARHAPAQQAVPLVKAPNQDPVKLQAPVSRDDKRPSTPRSPISQPAKRSRTELASPAAPDAKVRVIGKEAPQAILTFPLRLAGRHPARQMLRDKLRQTGPFHVEITCLGRGKSFARLQAQLKAQKIDVLVDPRVVKTLAAHGTRTDLALYTESLTARELSSFLEQLGEEDAEAAGDGAQFGTLAVSRLTEEDRVNLSILLGIDPAQLPSLNSAPLGVDIRQPLEDSTANDLTKALLGQGKPRPLPGQPVIKPKIPRTAVVVPLHPEATRAEQSKEIHRFLDSRKDHPLAAVPVLLILRGADG